jgi:hypothetical protein
MLDMLRRRAFLITGGLFLVYGVTAMGGSVVAGSAPETTRLPDVDPAFLRLRVENELLEEVGDPFQRRSEDGELLVEEPETPAADGPILPWLEPTPLPSEREPVAVVPEPDPLPVAPPEDNTEALFEWPEDFLLQLEATMSAGGAHSARINGELLETGQSLTVAGERFLLEEVRGVRVVLVWRGQRVTLDLMESPSVGAAEMPIEL